MTSRVVSLCDAIIAKLKLTNLPLEANFGRTYLPILELETSGILSVTLVPKKHELEFDNRSGVRSLVEIDLGIQKKLAVISNESIDPLMEFCEEIIDAFAFGFISNGYTLTTPSISILYHLEHLHKLRQFTAVVNLGFTCTYEPD